MQTSLIENEDKIIEIKKSFGGFRVMHPDSCSYGETDDDRVLEWDKERVDSFDIVSFAETEFAKEVIKGYRATGVRWLESKFKDSRGFFFLNGVKILWELESNYAGDMYHMNLDSNLKDNKQFANTEYLIGCRNNVPSGRVPNLITETGYRSVFATNLDAYDSVKDFLINYIEHMINSDETGKPNKKKKEYLLEWESSGYKPQQQMTLIDLKGGDC